jgi:PBP1b-binding outer membrane lipoprotein LpoB
MKRLLTAITAALLISGCASAPCAVCPPEDQYIITGRGILKVPKGFITDGHALTQEEMDAIMDRAQRQYQQERGY